MTGDMMMAMLDVVRMNMQPRWCFLRNYGEESGVMLVGFGWSGKAVVGGYVVV